MPVKSSQEFEQLLEEANRDRRVSGLKLEQFTSLDGYFRSKGITKEEFVSQKQHGQYFTTTNPFLLKPFLDWLEPIKHLKFVEPFAGTNNIPKMLPGLMFDTFDIEPKEAGTIQRDTIKDFPTGYKATITNVPYLAKNSATRRKLQYPKTEYDDLYKLALDRCLANCEYVAAIIPESFITAGLFHNRLKAVISLNFKMFDDTDCPVCLALFVPESETNGNFDVWSGEMYVGKFGSIQNKLERLKTECHTDITFNDPNGRLGLIAIDNNTEASIRFVMGDEIPKEEIKHSSRSRTRIAIPAHISLEKLIDRANTIIGELRESTQDVLLTSFKGLRKDDKYRRRIDFATARVILNKAIKDIE